MRSKKDAIEEIQSRTATGNIHCPICGSIHLRGENTLGLNPSYDGEVFPKSEKSMPVLILVCTNCFYVLEFHAGGLGLF